jgi:Holliday junction DNA helicase RuvB
MIGQTETIARLRIAIHGSRKRGVKPPHVLLSGPAGHGKTTMAKTIAQETGGKLEEISGPMLREVGKLPAILTSLDAGAIFFIDEIHRMPMACEETLYQALEDGTVSTVVGGAGNARTITLPLEPFTVVGATTKPGAMSTPFRDRFGLHLTVQPYTEGEIARIVERSWNHAQVHYSEGAPIVVAERAKGVPRLAVNLAARALDCQALEGGTLTPELVIRSMRAFGVNDEGLEEMDYRILDALVTTFAGRPVGLDNLAQALDTDKATIQEQHEGPLVRMGFVVRTPSGRMATEKAHAWIKGKAA